MKRDKAMTLARKQARKNKNDLFLFGSVEAVEERDRAKKDRRIAAKREAAAVERRARRYDDE